MTPYVTKGDVTLSLIVTTATAVQWSMFSKAKSLWSAITIGGRKTCTERGSVVAIDPSCASCSSFVTPVNPFFSFTSGHWLCNNDAQVKSRYAPFNVDGLQRVASKAMGSQVCGPAFHLITYPTYTCSTGTIHRENSRISQSSLPRLIPKRPASHRSNSHSDQRSISLLHC